MRYYGLEFPADLTFDDALSLTRALAVRPRRGLVGKADPVLLEVHATAGRLAWVLGVEDRERRLVLGALRHALPSVRVKQLEELDRPRLTYGIECRLSDLRRSMRTDVSEVTAAAVLNAAQGTRSGEYVVVQCLIGPWLHRPKPLVRNSRQSRNTFLNLGQLLLDNEEAAALKKKHAEPLFGITLRIGAKAGDRRRAQALAHRIMGTLQVPRASGAGLQRRFLPPSWVVKRLDRLHQPTVAWPIVVNAAELVSLLGWPVGAPTLPNVSYRGHRQLPAASASLTRSERSTRNLVTGVPTFPGQTGYVALNVKDALSHLHCQGPTGVGKSTLLTNLVVQALEQNRPVVVIDAKGDLVDDIAERVPEHRIDDIVLIEPDKAHAVGFNPLSGPDPDLAVDGIVHIFHELYAAHWGPRTQDILHNAALTLARHGNMTLCELPTLLTNSTFRRSVAQAARKDTLGLASFWSWFDHLGESERLTVIGPVMNKLRSFTIKPAIRNLIGQAEGFDLRRVFTERKVLLVNLSQGSLGPETAQLLGALLLSQLWQTIQGRADVSAERRLPALLVLDEFQEYLRLPADLGDVLARSRGLGVGVMLAHQAGSQLTPAIKAAVLANCLTRIAWQTRSHEDAILLAKVMGGGLTPQDFQRLSLYETYQTINVGGMTASPASVITLPATPSLGTAERVRRHSRATYARPVADIEAELLARRHEQPDETPIGATKRRRGTSGGASS